jgi:SAM-dependent methyltransferase
MVATIGADCPLCQRTAVLRSAALPGYVDGLAYSVYTCGGCGASFVDPRESYPGLYDRVYTLSAQVPGYHRYQRYAALAARSGDALESLASAEDVYWGVARALDSLPASSSSVLEIGSGLGYLTHALAQRGYAALGLDISGAAVDAARARFGDRFVLADLAKYAAAHSSTFDAVVACELIEHLVDPVGFVERAFSLVRPGGQLVLTTPNRSLFADDVLWETELPPVHFWWFAERSVEVLGNHVGGETSFIDFEPYQNAHPSYLGDLPANVPTRAALLSADLALTPRARTARRRARIGDVLPWIRTNAWMQRLRGKRRLTGKRRTVLCAIIRRPVGDPGRRL